MKRLCASITILAILAGIAACSGEPSTMKREEMAAVNQLFEAAELTPQTMEKWSRSCALCHVDGEGGAPRSGVREEWEERLARGREVMYRHTLEGYRRMPPLGYCMDCEALELAAMIKMMAGLD